MTSPWGLVAGSSAPSDVRLVAGSSAPPDVNSAREYNDLGGRRPRPGWRATDDEGGGYYEGGPGRYEAFRFGPGFDASTFSPLRPQFSIPGLSGGFPTLGMLQYLTQTDLARQQNARAGAEFAMNVGRQPGNWLDWWRLTRGQGRETAAGTPLPRFLGVGGQQVMRPVFPGMQFEGEQVALPSGQTYGQMTPSERSGLAGFYERLGVPLEDLYSMMQAPTVGLRSMGPGRTAARR